MKRVTCKYGLLTYRLDHLWLPAAFWALFAVVTAFLNSADQAYDYARAYMGTVVPMVAGVMGANAVLDDPALELRFSTPMRPERLLLERMGAVFAVQAICALAFQLYAGAWGADLGQLGNGLAVQMAWVVPTLALMALGCVAAFLANQPTIGAAIAGVVWLIELLARGWLARNAGKYVLVFMGALMPDHPALIANRIALLACSVAMLVGAWALLRRQERFI